MEEIRKDFKRERKEEEDITPWFSEAIINSWHPLPTPYEYYNMRNTAGLSDIEIVDRFRDWLSNPCYVADIRELTINMQKGESLPRAIGYFTNLTKLTIVGPCTKPLPKEIALLTKLKTLSYESRFYPESRFSPSVPEQVLLLPELISLDIRATSRMSDFPTAVLGMTQLKRLSIQGASFSKIPHAINCLSRLETLVVSGTFLNEIPTALAQMEQLKKT